MQHHFNVEVATKYGINSAILLDNFYYWIEKNRANGNNFYDGQYWTYNSKRALSELFPYLTEKQVRTAIENLVNDGVLITGNYNKLKMDKTTWYSITKKGYELLGDCRTSLFDLPMMSDAFAVEGKSLDMEGKAIPNEKTTYNKPYNNIVTVPPSPMDSPTGTDVLEEYKKEEEETAGRSAAVKPKRNYTAKPQIVIDEENKKLNREQKRQLRILEMLQTVPPIYGPELVDALGDYLNMRLGMTGCVRADKEWFEKEWNENIYPALQKHSSSEVAKHIREVVIPRQYRRCFISINVPYQNQKPNFFNDSQGYTDEEMAAAKEHDRRAIEEAKRNGTYRESF